MQGTMQTNAGLTLPGATSRAIDVPVLRSGALPLAPWVMATLADLGAVVLLMGRASPVTGAAAAALHLAALAPILLARTLTSSERTLGAAFVFAMPVAGAALAVLSLGTAGRGEVLEADPSAAAGAAEPLRAEELRRLGEALPCCEALLAGGVDERRAIIATLTRRADVDAVALLRWALGAADPDLAVEAALAIEEMTASCEARLAAYRKQLAEGAGAPKGTALSAAELATDAIETGLAEPTLVSQLAEEARGYYTTARAEQPERTSTIAIGRARLEMAVLRPDAALGVIDEVVDAADGDLRLQLLALRDEAVLATHTLPWESPSVLASYHPASPPPLIHRRLSAARRLSGIHRRGVTGGVSTTVGVVQVPAPASTREVPVDKG
jgi:hypothetical protein